MRRTLQSALLLGLSTLAAAVFKDEVGDIDFHYSSSACRDKTPPSSTDRAGTRRRACSTQSTQFKGEVKDLEILEITEASRKDVLALFDEDGVTVLRRLHGALGTVIWEFREHSKDVPLQVSNNIANVYVVSLHGSGSSYNLKVTSLDTATGSRVDHWSVGTKGDIHGPSDVMFVGANSAAPIVAWANSGLAKLSSQPHFLVHIQTKPDGAGEKNNKAIVFHTNLKTGQSDIAYELPYFRGEGAFSRGDLIVSSDSHAILARWPVKQDAKVHPVAAASEVVKKPGGTEFAVRSAVLTQSDDWTLIRNGEKDWTRVEGLSGAVAAAWAEIPEGEDLAKVLAEEAHTNPLSAYIHRVTRHIEDLQYLPGYLASIPGNVINSIAGGEIIGKKPGLHRDTNPLEVRALTANGEEGLMIVYGAEGEHATFNSTTGAWRTLVGAAGDRDAISSVAVVDTDGDVLKGVKYGSEGGKVTKQDIWQLQVFVGQKIVEVASLPSHNPIASIGRVLGDRRVMYKYLNPNSLVVAVADEKANSLSVQLLDAVSGQVLASQLYDGADSAKAVSCAMAENWYACSFFGDYKLDDNTDRSIKGYQVVVSDLYESPDPNSRGPLALSTLSVTQTRQGITTRELVAYLPESHSILGLSRHAIDPRRPVGREPTAAEMEAEALMKYAPAMEIDPRSILSHEYDVVGVRGIVAAPAQVESTSLLAAYGVDVYVTRVAPSGVFDILGQGFDKVTLVGTVLALLGGVMFVAPMVRRKQINMRWVANF
ncbi:hypothetical protein ACCO45_002261 [Purpureocillium lilacinum]|uniref:Uncharacterized protein n=1 Tax=Purpureocillium lilacinum TaxID=33203 RepID=A0ACC4E9J3_PURLI